MYYLFYFILFYFTLLYFILLYFILFYFIYLFIYLFFISLFIYLFIYLCWFVSCMVHVLQKAETFRSLTFVHQLQHVGCHKTGFADVVPTYIGTMYRCMGLFLGVWAGNAELQGQIWKHE